VKETTDENGRFEFAPDKPWQRELWQPATPRDGKNGSSLLLDEFHIFNHNETKYQQLYMK
jgi:hypothetical protein